MVVFYIRSRYLSQWFCLMSALFLTSWIMSNVVFLSMMLVYCMRSNAATITLARSCTGGPWLETWAAAPPPRGSAALSPRTLPRPCRSRCEPHWNRKKIIKKKCRKPKSHEALLLSVVDPAGSASFWAGSGLGSASGACPSESWSAPISTKCNEKLYFFPKISS